MTPTYYNRLQYVLANFTKGRRLLNVGCGSGDYNFYLRQQVEESFGVDASVDDVRMAQRLHAGIANVHFSVGDIHNLSFADGFFDRIICMDTLEHVADPLRAVAELFRVLEPGGQVIFSVPAQEFPVTYDPLNRARLAFGKRPWPIGAYGFGHEKLFSRGEFVALLGAKFQVREARFISFGLVGLIENYVPSLLARWLKTNKNNTGVGVSSPVGVEGKLGFDYRIPRWLAAVDRTIVGIDKRWFYSETRGVNCVVKAEKTI
jgi:SAM-dependent methyltransferase